MALYEGDNLVGRKEITEILHIQTSVIGNWRDLAHKNGFPEVAASLAQGPIWDVEEVVAWWLKYTPKPGHVKVGYLDDPQYWENRIKERNSEQA